MILLCLRRRSRARILAPRDGVDVLVTGVGPVEAASAVARGSAQRGIYASSSMRASPAPSTAQQRSATASSLRTNAWSSTSRDGDALALPRRRTDRRERVFRSRRSSQRLRVRRISGAARESPSRALPSTEATAQRLAQGSAHRSNPWKALPCCAPPNAPASTPSKYAASRIAAAARESSGWDFAAGIAGLAARARACSTSTPVTVEHHDYTLAYSPCPNDTYIFAALTNGLLDGRARGRRAHLADIEELNDRRRTRRVRAHQSQLRRDPVSDGPLSHPPLRRRARPRLRPAAWSRDRTSPRSSRISPARRIAIPGEHTTAFMLLRSRSAAGPKSVQMRFDRIVDAVANGEVDAGLIIHESRFTYREAGLIAIADLGEWWENMTLLPIPLGAILVRNDIDPSAGAGDRRGDSREPGLRARERSGDHALRSRARLRDERRRDARAHRPVRQRFSDDVGETGSRPSTRSSRARTKPAILEPRGWNRSVCSVSIFSRPPPRSRLASRSCRRWPNRCRRRAIELGDEVFLRDAWRELNGRSDRHHHQSKRRHLAAGVDRRRDR